MRPLCLALAALAVSAPAAAQFGATQPAAATFRQVNFADLDLESLEGGATLERRLIAPYARCAARIA